MEYEITYVDINGKALRVETVTGTLDSVAEHAASNAGKAHMAYFLCRGYYGFGDGKDLTWSTAFSSPFAP